MEQHLKEREKWIIRVRDVSLVFPIVLVQVKSIYIRRQAGRRVLLLFCPEGVLNIEYVQEESEI